MERTRKIQIIVLILVAFFIGYWAGTVKISFDWKNYKPVLSISGKQPPPSLSNLDFSNFWAVWENVESKYYDKSKIDPSKMLNGAINGMLATLSDPYTVYLPPVSNTDFKQGLAGQFEGIGAELGLKDKKITVISPLDDSPAQKAGIKPEDIILKVDGESTEGWSISQAVSKIRGKRGTPVVLTALHKNTKNPTDIKIIRDTITVKSVDGYVKKISEIKGIKKTSVLSSHQNDEIMYIKLAQFGDQTNKDWLALVNSLNLKAQDPSASSGQDKNFRGIILDLRNNPGGYLTDASFIAGEFLREGLPVVIQEQGTGDRTTISVLRRGLFLSFPLVVLINKGSASASEIVSGEGWTSF